MKVLLTEYRIFIGRGNLKIKNGEKCRFPFGHFDLEASKEKLPFCTAKSWI